MTSISSISTTGADSRADQAAARKSTGSPEFQAVLDKAESRAKSITGIDDPSTDDTTRKLAQLDSDTSVQLNQSEYDTGSASGTQAAGRLPPAPALFAQSADTTSLRQATIGAANPSSTLGDSDSDDTLGNGTDAVADSNSDNSATQRADTQQLAQQVLRQYQQVGSGTSASTSSGNSVNLVA